jgi:Protein of unknown function (DUF4232)
VNVRRFAIATLVVLPVINVASCGGSPRTASPTTASATTFPAPSTSVVTMPTTTTTSSTIVASAPPCRNGQLAVTPYPGGAAAGNVSQVIRFVNVSRSTCSLTGYPGIAALNASGAQVAQARRELSGMLGGLQNGAQSPPTVTLASGAVASATVEGGDNPVGTATSCPYYPAFLVTAPDQTQSVKVAVGLPGSRFQGFPGCSGIRVDPVVPGGSGVLH